MDVVDLTNKQFGFLTVKKYVGLTGSSRNGPRKGYHTWQCICVCGNTTNVRSVKLRSGCTKSCGCRKKYNKPIWTLPEGEAAKNLLYNSYKRSAKGRKLLFTISRNNFIKIATGSCYYCGSLPNKSVSLLHKGKSSSRSLNGDLLYNGVDRVDNSVGYILSNCVSCCWTCNQLKKAMSKESFITHIKKIAKYVGHKHEK